MIIIDLTTFNIFLEFITVQNFTFEMKQYFVYQYLISPRVILKYVNLALCCDLKLYFTHIKN